MTEQDHTRRLQQRRAPRDHDPAPSAALGGAVRLSGRSAREIAAAVEAAVSAGELGPGARLPSVRKLATQLDVSPTTVAAAVAELRRRGVVVSRPRSGTQVAGRPPLTAPRMTTPVPEGVRDLANGNPDPQLLPDLAPALRAAAAGPPRLYGQEAVTPELRAVAARALERDGIDASHLMTVNGALDGVERVLEAHLTGGDPVAVEDPGYAGVLDLARALGLNLVPVGIDDRGMQPAALDSALRVGAQALVITPRGQNPTGAALDSPRARELGHVLDRHPDVLVVEDDHLGPIAGVPARTLSRGRASWAAVRSTSKWLGPDLRLAVLAGDERTVARVEGRQAVGPGWVSSLVQRVVAALWDDPQVEALADEAAALYAGRRAALVAALAGHGIATIAPSGLNVWIPVPDEDAAVRSLLAAGWAVGAGARHRIQTPPAIRVTVATLLPSEAPELAAAVAGAVRPATTRTRAA